MKNDHTIIYGFRTCATSHLEHPTQSTLNILHNACSHQYMHQNGRLRIIAPDFAWPRVRGRTILYPLSQKALTRLSVGAALTSFGHVETLAEGQRAPLLPQILPASVIGVEQFGDAPNADLHPSEEAALGQVVESRRREFAAVRKCARLALARLGVRSSAIIPGRWGAPVWPKGVVGSMTHCDGYRAAAVADGRHVLALGIDGEPNQRLPGNVVGLVTGPRERRHLLELAYGYPSIAWDRLVFSAKESVFKAWFPLAQEWLGFDDAEVTVDPCAGAFDCCVRRVAANGFILGRVRGRWIATGDLIVTSVALPAAALSSIRQP